MWFFIIELFVLLAYLEAEQNVSKGYFVILIISALGCLLFALADYAERRTKQ